MNRRTHPIARCLGTALATTLAVASVLIAVPASAKEPHAPHHYSSAIEGLAGYSPQTTCSPTAKPGTVAFANLLLRTYKNSRSLGIVRACNVGGTSEHKEGRAFDWGVSAFNAQDRRSVNSVMHWLLKKDQYGNRYAMARRLGIQYMIWNHRIWGSYKASSGWRRYTGSNPHTDHVHFSLSWKGARKLTSFWRPKRFGQPAPKPPKPQPEPNPTPTPTPKPTPPEPKPKPGGHHGPDQGPSKPGSHKKSLPEPTSPASLRQGPPLDNEKLSLPARKREGVKTRGALQQGHTYLIEVSGTYRYAKSHRAVADAECSTAPRSQWQRNRSLRGDDWLDHLDVYIDGHDMYSEGDNGQECDTDSHTYRWYYQAERTGRAPLRIWDPVGFGDNHGKLSVHIVDVAAVKDKMAWRVPADAPAGATSPGSLQAGVEYQVTVSGVWSAGGGYQADAECSIAKDDKTWRRDRSADPYNPGADYFDVLQDKQDLGLDPLTDTGDRCDAQDHAYRYTFTPSETRPVNFRVDDATGYGNNRGDLRVKVVPYVEPAPQPIVTEQVTVDSRSATPVQTQQTYPRGAQLRVSVTGTYRWSTGLLADAECSQILYNGSKYWGNWRGGTGDLAVNGVIGTWVPNRDSGRGCDDAHGYTWPLRVDTTGPLTFGISDDKYDDNSGSLTVTVEEVR